MCVIFILFFFLPVAGYAQSHNYTESHKGSFYIFLISSMKILEM